MKNHKSLHNEIRKSLKNQSFEHDFVRLVTLAKRLEITLYDLRVLINSAHNREGLRRITNKGGITNKKITTIESNRTSSNEGSNNSNQSNGLGGNRPTFWSRVKTIAYKIWLWIIADLKKLVLGGGLIAFLFFLLTLHWEIKDQQNAKEESERAAAAAIKAAAAGQLSKDDLKVLNDKFDKEYERHYLFYVDNSNSVRMTDNTYKRALKQYLEYLLKEAGLNNEIVRYSSPRTRLTASLLADIPIFCDNEKILSLKLKGFGDEVKEIGHIYFAGKSKEIIKDEAKRLIEASASENIHHSNETFFLNIFQDIKNEINSYGISNSSSKKHFNITIISDFLVEEKEEVEKISNILSQLQEINSKFELQLNLMFLQNNVYNPYYEKFRENGKDLIELFVKKVDLVNKYDAKKIVKKLKSNKCIQNCFRSINAPTIDFRKNTAFRDKWIIRKDNVLKCSKAASDCFEHPNERWIFRLISERGKHKGNAIDPKVKFVMEDENGKSYPNRITSVSLGDIDCIDLDNHYSLKINEVSGIDKNLDDLILNIYNENFHKNFVIPVKTLN